MKLSFNITKDNLQKEVQKLEALSSTGALRILMLLKEKPMTLKEIDEVIHKEGIYKHRESSYKAVERMVKADLAKKEYDQARKKIIYSI